jgi:hypothetical protein
MPLTGDSQVNKKAFRIAINSRKLARFHPLDREKTAKKKSLAEARPVPLSYEGLSLPRLYGRAQGGCLHAAEKAGQASGGTRFRCISRPATAEWPAC